MKKHFVPLLKHLGLFILELGSYLVSLKPLEPLEDNNQAFAFLGPFLFLDPALHHAQVHSEQISKWQVIWMDHFFHLFSSHSQMFWEYSEFSNVYFLYLSLQEINPQKAWKKSSSSYWLADWVLNKERERVLKATQNVLNIYICQLVSHSCISVIIHFILPTRTETERDYVTLSQVWNLLLSFWR